MDKKTAIALRDYLREAFEKGLPIDSDFLTKKFNLKEDYFKNPLFIKTDFIIIITQKGIDFYEANKVLLDITITEENKKDIWALEILRACVFSKPPHIISTQGMKEEFLFLIEQGYAERYVNPKTDN